ncbi:hypothetical protein TSAR_013592 [Trichomalopsis sarcophagae]|uniref:Uncharacterized protein n=1 Tax=Trichomalopsis sarcophagae TaxID=543379 RepID=A0A232EEE2_9HYME|nr:hypothetical protein TSAR_013592 [Trichomalopsis sarcophagae]
MAVVVVVVMVAAVVVGGHTKADRRLAERAFSRMLSESSGSEEKRVALLTILCMTGKITFDRTGYKTYKEKEVEISW